MQARQLSNRVALAALAVLTALGTGCGGGSDPASSPATNDTTAAPAAAAGAGQPTGSLADACLGDSADCGTLVVGLTDADGDFLSYSTGVIALSLERNDGVTVEALPASTRVDFARYTELTELLTAATVPPGTYVSGSLTLDYTDAEIVVELDGVGVAATIVDEAGEPLTTQVVTVHLSNRNRLVIAAGVPSVMTLDFDLAASHDVALDTQPPLVTARPFLVAEIDPVEHKETRARGPLVAVDTTASTYTISLRPFVQWHGDYGRLIVHTGERTSYEIDGETYLGAAGLEAMSGLNQGTATVALGRFQVAERRFVAETVYAGSSVPGADSDVVRGVIVARQDDVITIRGATLVRERASVIFRDRVEVIVGPQTRVRKQGMPDFDGTADALSIGQQVSVFGRLANDTPGSLTLDATDGRVRMWRTVAAGHLLDSNDGGLVADLVRLGGRAIRLFDFTGSGLPGMDADPQEYEISVTSLDTASLHPGDPLKVSGFVTPFGLAPPDFEARSLADFSAADARLQIVWSPAADAAFLTLGDEGITPNLDAPLGRRHHMRRGGILTDLLDLDNQPRIVDNPERPGSFAIRQGQTIQVHTDFAGFVADLAARLDAGALTHAVFATGRWDAAGGVFTAHKVRVGLD